MTRTRARKPRMSVEIARRDHTDSHFGQTESTDRLCFRRIQTSVYLPGPSLRARRFKSSGHFRSCQPAVGQESVRLANRQIVDICAERVETSDALVRFPKRRGQILERKSRDRSAESREYARLRTLDVHLDKGRHPEPVNQSVERRRLDLNMPIPLDPAKPTSRLRASRHDASSVVTVGVRSLTSRLRRPSISQTAAWITWTRDDLANSTRSSWAKSGWGSKATTRHPSDANARVRFPACAPRSKTRSPPDTNSRYRAAQAALA